MVSRDGWTMKLYETFNPMGGHKPVSKMALFYLYFSLSQIIIYRYSFYTFHSKFVNFDVSKIRIVSSKWVDRSLDKPFIHNDTFLLVRISNVGLFNEYCPTSEFNMVSKRWVVYEAIYVRLMRM